jgi:hypothetical protein
VSINDSTRYHIYALIHTVSSVSQSLMEVGIHNRCSDFKLINLEYFNTSEEWEEYPYWKVDSGNMLSVGFRPFLSVFEGALTYELRGKYVKLGNRPRSTCIRFFLAWKSEDYNEFRVCMHLIEHDKQFYWSTAKSKEYHRRYANELCIYTGPIKDTWLLHDGTVLMTRLELDPMQRVGRLNITISESVKNERTKIPVWINLER